MAGFSGKENKMSMMSKLRAWRTYHNTVSELNAMSQRDLDDMGIARGQIRELARKASR
jgi:uncharacterized protein YjiS (DUF1127 family)